jgi:hypothetical protein
VEGEARQCYISCMDFIISLLLNPFVELALTLVVCIGGIKLFPKAFDQSDEDWADMQW